MSSEMSGSTMSLAVIGNSCVFSVLWRVRLLIHPAGTKPKGLRVGCAPKVRSRDQLYQGFNKQICQKTEMRYEIRILKHFIAWNFFGLENLKCSSNYLQFFQRKHLNYD